MLILSKNTHFLLTILYEIPISPSQTNPLDVASIIVLPDEDNLELFKSNVIVNLFPSSLCILSIP